MNQKTSLFVVMTLILSLVGLSFTPTVSAASNQSEDDSNMDDLYLNQESETVSIDDTSYTYDYSYEDNKRVINITNNDDNSVEKVAYDEDNSTVYYNGEALYTEKEENDIKPSSYAVNSTDTWKPVNSSSEYISWARGISAAALAAIIAAPLASLGAAGVISAIGTGALGTIAAGSSGGNVQIQLQKLTPKIGASQYRYAWWFAPSTGEHYGPFYYRVVI